jgi:hypothetical protein
MSCSLAARPDQEARDIKGALKSGRPLGQQLNDTLHTRCVSSVAVIAVAMQVLARKADICIITHLASDIH